MIKTWLNKSKQYPNGSTFTRYEAILFTAGLSLLTITLFVSFYLFLKWDIQSLIERWKWATTHSFADVMKRNDDFALGVLPWCTLLTVVVMAVFTLIKQRESKAKD